MRAAVTFLLYLSLFLSTSAHAWADAADGNFNLGVWRGSPVTTGGSFAFCGMLALFGQKDAPVALTIGLDRMQGWVIAISSDQFKLPPGRIKAGLAFDDEAPVDVQGDVKSTTMMSFKFPNTGILDRHAESRKLVLIFRDVALPFMLPQFGEATKALRGCVQANSASAVTPSVTPDSVAQTTLATSPDLKTMEPELADSRLFSEIVGPVIVGFVGSVLLVLLAGAILFQVNRARAKSRYLRLWSAEYRARAPQSLALGLFEPITRHPTDARATA